MISELVTGGVLAILVGIIGVSAVAGLETIRVYIRSGREGVGLSWAQSFRHMLS